MSRRGFTLVELMIVVAIVIILAAILVPRFVDVTTTSKTARCHVNQRTLEAAGMMYMGDVANTQHHPPASGTDGSAELVPNFIAQIPNCPEAGAGSYSFVDAQVVCSFGGDHDRNF